MIHSKYHLVNGQVSRHITKVMFKMLIFFHLEIMPCPQPTPPTLSKKSPLGMCPTADRLSTKPE